MFLTKSFYLCLYVLFILYILYKRKNLSFLDFDDRVEYFPVTSPFLTPKKRILVINLGKDHSAVTPVQNSNQQCLKNCRESTIHYLLYTKNFLLFTFINYNILYF